MKLRDCLEARGIKQAALSRASGVMACRISQICLGRTRSFWPERQRLVKALLLLKIPKSEVGRIEELKHKPGERRWGMNRYEVSHGQG